MKFASAPDMIAHALREAGGVERAVTETGRMTPAICHGLRALGIPVVCIDARQAHQSLKALKANKTDPNDAAGLAQLARTGQSAQAQNTVIAEPVDWSAQFVGLDGVAITCIRTIKRDYTERAYQQLMGHAASALKQYGIPHVVAGTYYNRDPAPEPTSLLSNPLNLTIHLRATEPNPLGIDIRMNTSVSYAAAVEKDGNKTPRRGELLMWQHGTTGAGSAQKLEPAIVQASKSGWTCFWAM